MKLNYYLFALLRVFHICVCRWLFPGVWQQVSARLQDSSRYSGRSFKCCSLNDCNSSSYFKVFQFLYQSFGDCSAPVIIGIAVTLVFHSFSSSQAKSRYLSLVSRSFSFTLWSAWMAKSTIWKFLFFFFFFFFYYH